MIFLLQLVQIYKNLESGLVHISILDCPIKTSVPGPRLMSYICYDMEQKEHTILSLIGSKKVTYVRLDLFKRPFTPPPHKLGSDMILHLVGVFINVDTRLAPK